ncbi:MAG: Nucleoside-diphosphate-sugar epimerase [Pseudomonas sp.]|nr:Nucleoside-diphosphate-sugar epimerase [Pseudomonas sp.]
MKILITGASGFLGGALVRSLSDVPGVAVVAAARRADQAFAATVARSVVEVFDGTTDWTQALTEVDVVVHAAARVHVMNDTCADPLAMFREANTAVTLNLARQAAKAGVKRFIFISTIKVNGEETGKQESFGPDDLPQASDPYAISKMEAEKALLAHAQEWGIEVVIIRPVLIYGPGVKANFLSLMRLLRRGWPLPLGAIDNRRSLVSIDNLVDFIKVCIEHPAAANEIFLVSDGHDLSTTELVRELLKHLGVKSWLIPVPSRWILWMSKFIRREQAARRLVGSLCVDISKNHQLLGWLPPHSLDEGLSKTVKHFLASGKQ